MIKKTLIIFTAIALLFGGLVPTFAQSEENKAAGDPTTLLGQVGNSTALTSGEEASISTIVSRIINQVLSIIGVILVIIIIFAGFLWLTAGGNAEQVKKAKSWLTNAIIGMVIVFGAYIITSFIVDAIVG